MIDRAILPDEVYDGEEGAVPIEGKAVGEEDVEREGGGAGEKGWAKEEGELRVF